MSRYIERNPVAAGLVAQPADWPWSSCRAHLGLAVAPPWLKVAELDRYLMQRAVARASDRADAAGCYAALVGAAAPDEPTIWQRGLRQQVYLGDAALVERMQAMASAQQRAAPEVPKPQRQSARTWPECLAFCGNDRAQALRMAYREDGVPRVPDRQGVD